MWRNSKDDDDDDDGDDDGDGRGKRRHHWIEPILNMSVEELKSRIGELAPQQASSRLKWEWDQIRRSVFSKDEDEIDGSLESRARPLNQDDKTGPCIGSIFGMDVGGTLAKLVYFEQGSLPLDTATATNNHLHPTMTSSSSQQSSNAANGMHKRSGSASDIWDMLGSSSSSSPRARSKTEEARAGNEIDHDGITTPTSFDDSALDDSSTGRSNAVPIIDVSNKDHAEALDRFYNFARRFDQYQTGVKEKTLSFYSRELGGEFHFIRFETREMEAAMDLIRLNNLHLNICEMGATGGGAHKFSTVWERVLGIKMQKQQELDSLVAGMQFVLSTVVGECYSFRPRIRHDETPCDNDETIIQKEEAKKPKSENKNETQPQPESSDSDQDAEGEDEYQGDDWWWSRKVQRDVVSHQYPYLLVTIGTGVSILRVDGPRKHVRVSGSTIGGGTYWGLIRLLTDSNDFDSVLKLAEKGDPTKVDMMVGDIYGKNSDALEKLGLPSNLVASSFGKLVAKRNPAANLKKEDLARALLLMVTNNIGQVAYLNAKLHKTPRIYFVGNFLRHNKISQRRLAFAIDYWSKGEMEALFLEHEGYFGALGAFLLSQGISHGEKGFVQKVADGSNSAKGETTESLHTKPDRLYARSSTIS